MFHNILLLGPGGKTVYQGTVSDAAEYFSASLGFTPPANVNPADFYMDVIGGSVKIGDKEIDLFESWNEKCNGEETQSTSEEDLVVLTRPDPEGRTKWLFLACMMKLKSVLDISTEHPRDICGQGAKCYLESVMVFHFIYIQSSSKFDLECLVFSSSGSIAQR